MATLRIITANLYNGAARPSVVRKLIGIERPDVLVTQELAPNAARVIEEELPYGRLDPRLDHHGSGIALRLPGVVDRFSLAHRDASRAILEPSEWPELQDVVEIVGVHLLNPFTRPLTETYRLRRAQVDAILRHCAEYRVPRVVIGDLNASPTWPTYRRLAMTLQDAARSVRTPRRTWAPLWWMPRLLRIDHVLVEGLVPLAVRTRRVRRSDHSAVVVDVSVG